MADQFCFSCFKDHFSTSSKYMFCLILMYLGIPRVIFSMESEPKCKFFNNFVIPNNFRYLFRRNYKKAEKYLLFLLFSFS